MPPPPPEQTTQRRALDGSAHRPGGHQARKLARITVVAPEWAVGREARRAEEDDGVVDPFAAKRLQRFEVLGEDPQRPRLVDC